MTEGLRKRARESETEDTAAADDDDDLQCADTVGCCSVDQKGAVRVLVRVAAALAVGVFFFNFCFYCFIFQ